MAAELIITQLMDELGTMLACQDIDQEFYDESMHDQLTKLVSLDIDISIKLSVFRDLKGKDRISQGIQQHYSKLAMSRRLLEQSDVIERAAAALPVKLEASMAGGHGLPELLAAAAAAADSHGTVAGVAKPAGRAAKVRPLQLQAYNFEHYCIRLSFKRSKLSVMSCPLVCSNVILSSCWSRQFCQLCPLSCETSWSPCHQMLISKPASRCSCPG